MERKPKAHAAHIAIEEESAEKNRKVNKKPATDDVVYSGKDDALTTAVTKGKAGRSKPPLG